MNAKKNIEKFRTNPKIRVFLILLFLSAAYWFFTSLSEKYIYLADYKINYTNVPENLIFQNIPSEYIQVQIETSGFEILSHKLNTKDLTIDVSKFKPLENYTYYYLPNTQIPTIQKQLNDIKLIQFSKDSIFIYLGSIKAKKVPIISDVQLNFKPGFKLTKNLIIKPDSIIINGPEKYIDSISYIKTISDELNLINQSFNLEIPLVLPDNTDNKLSFTNSKVELIGNVAKYTEGKIELQISLPKLPDKIQLELFPKTATLKYQVTFDNYQKIDTTSFKLTCNYPSEELENKKSLNLFLSKKPDFINYYSIEPQQVNYLIRHLK